jgi:two-component system NtrC family sensor kinase
MSDVFPSNRRLLVIDDNPAIHDDFRKILNLDDTPAEMLAVEADLFGIDAESRPDVGSFELVSAHTGQEGLSRIQRSLKEGMPFSVAFIDVRMVRGWDGIETAGHILHADADIQVVMCTAYSDYSWTDMMEKLGQSDRLLILKKPFDSIEVLQLAHALSGKWALRQAAQAKVERLEQLVGERTRELQAANTQLKKEMAERERVEDALRQAQKMEALGQLAGGVAHDFNNLLTVIRGYAQCLLADGQQASTSKEALTQIDAAAERAAKLTSQMLVFSRKKRLQAEYLNLNEVITQLNKMLRRMLGEDIAMQFQHSAKALGINADRAMIEQIVMNLAVNARDAMPSGGSISIETTEAYITDSSRDQHPKGRPGRFACLSVSDTGCGIPAEAVPHLFEPFYTTKAPGKGTGLGLATVYGVVKQHDGWIDVASEVGKGTTFRIYLPLVAENDAVPLRRKTGEAAGRGTETILLVEDEAAVRSLAQRILTRHGYRVIPAKSGVEALSLWEDNGRDVDLLLTDMVMPEGVSGWNLAQKLRLKKPTLKTIFTTGYSVDAVCQDNSLDEGLNFLPKPYYPESLINTVRRCLDHVEVPSAQVLTSVGSHQTVTPKV